MNGNSVYFSWFIYKPSIAIRVCKGSHLFIYMCVGCGMYVSMCMYMCVWEKLCVFRLLTEYSVFKLWVFHTPSNSVTPAGCLSYKLIPCWRYLSGDSIRSLKTAPSIFRGQSKVRIVTCASDQLAISWRFQWLPPPPQFPFNLFGQLTEFRGMVYLLDRLFVTIILPRNSLMGEIHRARWVIF